jgi:hypothetical protein
MTTENSESTLAEPRRSMPAWLAIPDRKLQVALENATWAGLRPAAFGLAALLAALGLSAPLMFGSDDIALRVGLTLAAAAVLLITAFVLGRIPPPAAALPRA